MSKDQSISVPKLHVVYPTNFREVVPTLRRVADEIEAGEHGDVSSLGIVLMGNSMEVFGMGVDADGPAIALLFQAAALRFAKAIEEHGASQ